MAKTIVVISDTQIPYHHKKALKAVINFIGEYQPDEVVQIGDLMDYPQPSRWSKDTKAEFEGSVYADSEIGKRDFLEPLRGTYDGPIGVIEGNHDLRPRDYLNKYAPALSGTTNFDFDVLLDFASYDVKVLPGMYDFAPGWSMTHGHLGKFPNSYIGGGVALGGTRKTSRSIVMGHTHKLGMISNTTGFGGEVKQQLTGVEVGHLMDQRMAGYLNGGTANWQMGFAILYVSDKGHVQPTLVPMGDEFIVEGQVFNV